MRRGRENHSQPANLMRSLLHILVWIGAASLYYIIFSLLFDTPAEHAVRKSTYRLKDEYEVLSARYDSLTMAMESLTARDRNIFQIMFDSNPYDLSSQRTSERLAEYEYLLSLPSKALGMEFDSRLASLEKSTGELYKRSLSMVEKIEAKGSASRKIPAIQPIINDKLTLLTASYGMRIHPFYKTLVSHQGVDYTVPEGTRIFATADGVVKSVVLSHSTLGKNMVIDHGNGYQTAFTNMGRINIPAGRSVKRGDIIGLTGNTGFSITPHLHYEVRYNEARVDPIHYFFMELTPGDYQRMIRIAQSGMQSFD
ncbi:MAG: M23 family metallopeptidase [Rikenellaceae bacterium]